MYLNREYMTLRQVDLRREGLWEDVKKKCGVGEGHTLVNIMPGTVLIRDDGKQIMIGKKN